MANWDSSPMQQEKSHRMPWSILSGAILLAFVMYLPMACVPPMEHILKAELALTHAQTSFLFSIPIMMIGAVALPAGLIADKIGVRKAAGIGAIMLALGSILRATATTHSSLIAFTFIYGLGLGWVWPNLPKLVGAWVPREKAGLTTGIYAAGMYVGAAIAIALTMPIVFPITNTFQGVFFIWGIPPIVAAVLWWILIKEPPHSRIAEELVTQDTTSLHRVLRNKSLWLLSAFFLLYCFFMYTWMGWSPALLALKGATPELAGLIASITMWIAIPTVFIIPRFSHKLGLRKPFLWVTAFILAGTSLIFINITQSMSWLPMAVVGVCEGTLMVITIILPIEMVPEKDIGTASGLMLGIGHAGALIGPWISGYLFDLTGNLNASLLLLAGIAIAAAGIAFRLPETGPRARAKK